MQIKSILSAAFLAGSALASPFPAPPTNNGCSSNSLAQALAAANANDYCVSFLGIRATTTTVKTTISSTRTRTANLVKTTITSTSTDVRDATETSTTTEWTTLDTSTATVTSTTTDTAYSTDIDSQTSTSWTTVTSVNPATRTGIPYKRAVSSPAAVSGKPSTAIRTACSCIVTTPTVTSTSTKITTVSTTTTTPTSTYYRSATISTTQTTTTTDIHKSTETPDVKTETETESTTTTQVQSTTTTVVSPAVQTNTVGGASFMQVEVILAKWASAKKSIAVETAPASITNYNDAFQWCAQFCAFDDTCTQIAVFFDNVATGPFSCAYGNGKWNKGWQHLTADGRGPQQHVVSYEKTTVVAPVPVRRH